MSSPYFNSESAHPVGDFLHMHASRKRQIDGFSPSPDYDATQKPQNRHSASQYNSSSARDVPGTAYKDSTQIPGPSDGDLAGYPPQSPLLSDPEPTHMLSAITPYRSQPVTPGNIREQPKGPSTQSKRPVDLESHITTEAGHLFRRFLDPPPTISEMLDIADALILFAGLADLGSGQERTKDAMKRFTETYHETCEGEWYQFYETFDEYMHVKSLPISVRGLLWDAMERNGLGSPLRRIPEAEDERSTYRGSYTENRSQKNQNISLDHPVDEVKNRDTEDDCDMKKGLLHYHDDVTKHCDSEDDCHTKKDLLLHPVDIVKHCDTEDDCYIKEDPDIKKEPEDNSESYFETLQVQKLDVPMENESEYSTGTKRKDREGRTPRTGREFREIDRSDEDINMLWAENC
ncbi:hypothetical protein BZA77DRAFT_349986 [Pyronema omphalodes]|nr:hypothetical protein BZA77DRAFT_349986 [Pyronema omphalodes]